MYSPRHTQRFQNAIFDTQELAPGFFIELPQFLPNRLVQLTEGKELPVPQGGGNPG
jgi:hypothetical protein